MKKTLAIILSLALVVAIPFNFYNGLQTTVIDAHADSFVDGDPLKYLESAGIMEGYEDGKLHPERNLTRAEFATILSRAFSDVVTHQLAYEFSDLPYTHWAYSYVQRAVNAGWLKGNGDGTFCPDDYITYEQAVTVICRISGMTDHGAKYPDDYINFALTNQLTDGVGSSIGKVINRQQTAQLIVNTIDFTKNNMPECDYPTVPEDAEYYDPGSGGGGGGGGGAASGGASLYSMIYDGYYDSKNYTSGESYTSNDENAFKSVSTSPLSTFSIDADTASYSNMRRFIMNGQHIPDGAIRIEELINYFDYERADVKDTDVFGVNYTVSTCPWNKDNLLAMVTVSGEELKEDMPSNIVFLIDVSGSMDSYNKLPLVKNSLSMLIENLGEDDKVSVVTYASGVRLALEPTSASEKEKIMNVVNNLFAYGGTYGEKGINLAYETAEKSKINDGNNRIILCTDGDFNVGASSLDELTNLIEEKRESGIFLSVLGFGMGNYKDNTMELLADKGNGNYAYIDTAKEAKRVMADQMSKTMYTIAKDVKIQVEFNPETVAEYRLVGYENRILNEEDFDNDKKDAGELGAGATVTVLYEIVPSSGAESNRYLKYQTVQTTGSDELMHVKIRYKLPQGDESILKEYPVSSEITEATEDFKFASAVAMFGMILNNSEYKGTSTLDFVTDLAQQGIGNDPYGIRGEFVQLVDLYRYQQK